jgi:hypothetical protein
MPQVKFEPTIPASERAKTVHALDRAAAVIGYQARLAELFTNETIKYDYLFPYKHSTGLSSSSIPGHP